MCGVNRKKHPATCSSIKRQKTSPQSQQLISLRLSANDVDGFETVVLPKQYQHSSNRRGGRIVQQVLPCWDGH